MKIYLIYDLGPPALHHKLAITLPAKWLEQSSDKVKECFVERYNKKFPEYPLDDEELVLCIKDGSPFTNKQYKYLTSSDTPAACFTSGMDVRLVPPEKKAAPGMTASGKLRCKNFGCQCEYDDADNKEGACRHHVEPPVFHDTRKWWSCCEDVKVFEFDELLCIQGCTLGKHSNQPPAIEVQRKAELAAANAATLEKFEAKASADGAVDFLLESNVEGCCVYHKDAPVFHEGAKKWTCCGAVKYDFDDFLAVPGCCTGKHEEAVYID